VKPGQTVAIEAHCIAKRGEQRLGIEANARDGTHPPLALLLLPGDPQFCMRVFHEKIE